MVVDVVWPTIGQLCCSTTRRIIWTHGHHSPLKAQQIISGMQAHTKRRHQQQDRHRTCTRHAQDRDVTEDMRKNRTKNAWGKQNSIRRNRPGSMIRTYWLHRLGTKLNMIITKPISVLSDLAYSHNMLNSLPIKGCNRNSWLCLQCIVTSFRRRLHYVTTRRQHDNTK